MENGKSETFLLESKVFEKDIERFLKKKVEEKNGVCLKFNASVRGVPDRLAIFPDGQIWFVELKRGKYGVLSPLQTYMIRKLRDLDQKVAVLSSKAEITRWIFELENTSKKSSTL